MARNGFVMVFGRVGRDGDGGVDPHGVGVPGV
jgi:hypothetical protein